MIEIYTSSSCRSCSKAIKWLKKHHIPYIEQNIYDILSKPGELEKILKYTSDGFDSIISSNGGSYQQLNVKFDNLKMSQAIEIIKKHKTIIRKPIILDIEHENIEIGYNEDTIKIFGLASNHNYKTCPLSIEECRKVTRIKMFKENMGKIEEHKKNKNVKTENDK